jgi:ADP-ribose pyrophosphatase
VATAYSGRLFAVEVAQLRMHNGVHSLREMVRHPGAVCGVPVGADDSLYLVTQYRLAAGRRLLELPAGTLEPGEDPAACIVRELQEEIGMRPGSVASLGGFFVAPGYTSEYIHLFACSDLAPSSLAGDDDEDIAVHRLTLDQALAAIEEGRICDAKSVIGILRWARRLGV